jgi:hypothetical protein
MCATSRNVTRREMIKMLGITAAAGAVAGCAPAPAAPAAPAAAPAATEAPKAAAEAPKPTEAPAAAAGSKELILWGLKYDPHITKYNALGKAFTEKTGITVTVQPQDDPFGKPLVALAAGNPPDVACVMGKGLPPYLAKNAVVDVTDSVYKAAGSDVQNDWFGDGIPCYTWRGKLYGVPTEFSTISLAGAWPTEDKKYNAITADDAKLYPPKNGKIQFESYDQMWELAKKLQVEKDGKTIRYGMSSAGWEFSYVSSMLTQMGRQWWDANTKKFDFDNEDMIKVLQLLVETPVKMGIEADLGDTQTNLAQQQKVALARGNVAVIFFLKEVDLWYECFTPPNADPSKPNKFMGEGGWGFITLPKIKNEANAIEFLKWLTTVEGQQVWMTNFVSNYMVPVPLIKANEHKMWDDTGDKYGDVIRHMYKSQFPMLKDQTFFGGEWYISQVETAVSDACTQIRQQKIAPADGAKLIQDRAVNQLKQWEADNAA